MLPSWTFHQIFVACWENLSFTPIEFLIMLVKFRFSKKASKIWLSNFKGLRQLLVAFSEYINFISVRRKDWKYSARLYERVIYFEYDFIKFLSPYFFRHTKFLKLVLQRGQPPPNRLHLFFHIFGAIKAKLCHQKCTGTVMVTLQAPTYF